MSVPSPRRSRRIFLSHAHEDNEFCRSIASMLRGLDFDVWYDEESLGSGVMWGVIEKELRSRDTFLVILSPDSLESYWVQAEYQAAWRLYGEGKMDIYAPIVVRPCEVPLLMGGIRWFDFANQPFDATASTLLKALGATDDEIRRVIAQKQGGPPPAIWELRDSINTHVGCFGICWSPDGRYVATGSHDRQVRVWDVASKQCVQTFTGHEHWVDAVAWSPDGKLIASASQGHRIRIWDIAAGKQALLLDGHTDGVKDIAWSRDGSSLVSGSNDQTVRIWDAHTGLCRLTIRGPEKAVTSVAWSPDNTLVGATARDAKIRVWVADTGSLVMTLTGHKDVVHCMRWSPDGTRLASSGNTTIRLWNSQSGEMIRTFEGREKGLVVTLAWRPDGTIIASGSADHGVRLWGAQGERITITPGMHTDWVHGVAWSPDGMTLASCAGINDGLIKFWGPA